MGRKKVTTSHKTRCIRKGELEMTENETHDYWASRKSQILTGFDETTGPIYSGLVSAYFGDDLVQTIMKEIRDEFEALIPQIPYVGGERNIYGPIFEMAVPHLALYRVLKSRGKSTVEIGKIIYFALEIFFDKFPPTFMGFAEMDQKELMEFHEQAAAETQKRKYPGDWVLDIPAPGKDGDYDFAYDELECGLCKFFEAQGASEIMPYICFADFVISRACGTGLCRTKTLAEGGDKCDFRYKYGRPVTEGWPPEFLKPEDLKYKEGH